MTDPPGPRQLSEQDVADGEQDVADGEQYAGDHDPGPGEQYAGEPVPDPWEEEPDGQLDSGAEPGLPA